MIPFSQRSGGRRRSGNSATFLATDTTTQGAWVGVYGSAGYWIEDSNASINDTNIRSLPTGVTVVVAGATGGFIWEDPSSAARSLMRPDGLTSNRIASTWYVGVGTETFTFSIAGHRTVRMYFLDFDSSGRTASVAVKDNDTGATLDGSRTVNAAAGYATGLYLAWTMSGNVRVEVTFGTGPNSTVSGIFFD